MNLLFDAGGLYETLIEDLQGMDNHDYDLAEVFRGYVEYRRYGPSFITTLCHRGDSQEGIQDAEVMQIAVSCLYSAIDKLIGSTTMLVTHCAYSDQPEPTLFIQLR